jgi:hypothetical protein
MDTIKVGNISHHFGYGKACLILGFSKSREEILGFEENGQ